MTEQTTQPSPDPAQQMADVQRRLAALESPAPATGGISALVASGLAALDKPDSILMGQVRHYLGIGGAALVTHGYASNSDAAMLSGTALALVGCLWSIVAKYAVTHWLKIAVLVPPETTQPELTAIVPNVRGPVTGPTVNAAVAATKIEGGK